MPAPQRVTFIPIETVLEMIENEEPHTIVDVLAPEEYAKGHLPNALSIPGEEIEEKAPRMLPDKNAAIVVYCGSFQCHASTEATRKLQEMGYTRVLDYKGGKKDWADRGMPLPTG